MSSGLHHLSGLVDLWTVPLSEPGGRLLLRRAASGDGLQVSTAVYERSPDECGPIECLRFLAADGSPEPLEWTTRPDRVDLLVGDRPAVVAFVEPDLLMVGLPLGPVRVELTLLPGPGQVVPAPEVTAGGAACAVQAGLDPGAGAFAWSVGGSIARCSMDQTRGRPVVDVELTAREGDVMLIGRGSAAVDARARVRPRVVLQQAEDRWGRRLAAVPRPPGEPEEPLLRAAWVLATNTLTLPLEPDLPPAVVPSKMGYIAMWQWDAYFHAIGLRHLDPAAARDQLRLALHWQTREGMLPDLVHDAGVVAASDEMSDADRERSLLHIGRKLDDEEAHFLSAPLTKPPLTAWAAWKVHLADPDQAFLEEVYPAIVRSQRWWFEHSQPPGYGAPIYLHPYSSGIDDSPLWDLGMPVETPDLPAYLALQADHLALMADALGDHDAALDWRRQAAVLVDVLVARHWSEEAGSFISFHDGRPLASDTVIGLIPIVSGRLSPPIAERLVATLSDPLRFWAPYPVPSVALGDPDFDPARMWRGPSWLFVDYLLVDGLARSGFADRADELRSRVRAMVEQGTAMPEFYDPTTGARPAMATATFSGTAALYLDLVLDRLHRPS